jgi:hypothetical protein
MVRLAAARIFAARVVTPDLLADIADEVTDILVRNEQARRHHWLGKNLRPPPLKAVRTPWTPR